MAAAEKDGGGSSGDYEAVQRDVATRLMPEYVLPYAVHLLANHPEFPEPSRFRDAAAVRPFARCLELVVEPLIFSLGSEADNLTFLLKMLDSIVNTTVDAVDPTRTAALHCLARIAHASVRKKVKTQENLQPYPGTIFLPTNFYGRAAASGGGLYGYGGGADAEDAHMADAMEGGQLRLGSPLAAAGASSAAAAAAAASPGFDPDRENDFSQPSPGRPGSAKKRRARAMRPLNASSGTGSEGPAKAKAKAAKRGGGGGSSGAAAASARKPKKAKVGPKPKPQAVGERRQPSRRGRAAASYADRDDSSASEGESDDDAPMPARRRMAVRGR